MLTNVGSGGGAAPAAGGAAAGGDAAAAPAAEEEKAKEEEKEDVRAFFSCSFNHLPALCTISQMTTWASVSSIRAKIASYHYRFAKPDRQSATCLESFSVAMVLPCFVSLTFPAVVAVKSFCTARLFACQHKFTTLCKTACW